MTVTHEHEPRHGMEHEPRTNSCWAYNGFKITDDGHVTGNAHTERLPDGSTIFIEVSSYPADEPEHYAPTVTRVKPDGEVTHPENARDTETPSKAIWNAKKAGERAYTKHNTNT